MANSVQINLSLDFSQVLDLVRQLPKKQQKQIAEIIGNEDTPSKRLTDKEQEFLKELDEAVEFVNNYTEEKTTKNTFKQMLDAL